MTSQFDPENYRFKAVIDWVALSITLPSATQFRHLQNKLAPNFGKLFVKPCKGDETSMKFHITIQNPVSPDQILSGLQSLTFSNGWQLSEADIRVVGLELAIDLFTSPETAVALLTVAAQRMAVCHAHPPGSLRITKPKHYFAPATKRDIFTELHAGYSLHAGERYGTHTSHYYVKRHDTNEGVQYAPLPVAQHRARFENTWRGDLTPPFKTLDEWRNFRFESLSEQFALVKPAPATGLAELLQSASNQLGRPLKKTDDEPRHPDAIAKSQLPNYRRNRAASTQRDTPTNEKIRQALRNLTKTKATKVRENSVDLLKG